LGKFWHNSTTKYSTIVAFDVFFEPIDEKAMEELRNIVLDMETKLKNEKK
jgi:hypothetical protein